MKLNEKIVDSLKWKIKVYNGNFISMWFRPVLAKDVLNKTYITTEDKIAIIIQGGLWEKYNFTLETIKLYKKHYPNAIIILSTWADIQAEIIAPFKELGIEILLNEKPKPIPGNGNLQVISTQAGIIRAKEFGCKYICKSRTDQRMYATGIFPYLIKLINKFPINVPCELKGRIVTIGSNTFRNRLYGINDMWCFGYAEDVERYWACSPDFMWDEDTLKHIQEQDKFTESYICISFLKSLKIDLKWTLEDTIQVYANLFVIIDLQSLDLYFAKRTKEYFNKSYDDERNIEFSFRDWMALQ